MSFAFLFPLVVKGERLGWFVIVCTSSSPDEHPGLKTRGLLSEEYLKKKPLLETAEVLRTIKYPPPGTLCSAGQVHFERTKQRFY